MSECVSCKAPLPDDATFCSSCGRSQQTAARAAVFDPAARQAASTASRSVKDLVVTLGMNKVLCAIGGLFGIAGAVLPLVSISIPSGVLGLALSGLTLLRIGAPGVIVLLLAVVMGVAPFVVRPERSIALGGLGLATIVLANIVTGWIVIAAFQSVIQVADSMSTAYGSVPTQVSFGPAGGFYCLLIGFAILFYAYVREASG